MARDLSPCRARMLRPSQTHTLPKWHSCTVNGCREALERISQPPTIRSVRKALPCKIFLFQQENPFPPAFSHCCIGVFPSPLRVVIHVNGHVLVRLLLVATPGPSVLQLEKYIVSRSAYCAQHQVVPVDIAVEDSTSPIQPIVMYEKEIWDKMRWRRRYSHSIISSIVLLKTTASSTSLIDRRVSGQSHNSPRSLSSENRKATLDNTRCVRCLASDSITFASPVVSFALLCAYLTNLASGFRLWDAQLNLTTTLASM